MSWLIELLLPIRDPEGASYPAVMFNALQRELTDRFGGVTAHVRAPAKGRWEDGGRHEEDDVVIYEVMVETLDRDWWRGLRQRLERELRQKEILMRAHEVERL